MADSNDEVADYQEGEYEGVDYDEGNYEEQNQQNEEEPEDMRKKVLEMESELDKLTKIQMQVEKQITSASDSIDENSIYVGQVDYEATPDELRAHFGACGTINRITIMVDKITGQAKGFAYVEFVDKESVDNALKLDDTPFKGRNLKVLPKRQNIPSSVLRGGRGGGRGRGTFRGGRGSGFPGGRGYRGGGRGFRGGRGRGRYSGFSYY